MTTADSNVRIVYEGPGAGAELMGASQANFILLGPGADKEVAVLLNDPAAAFLAERLGVEPTGPWREAATREAGRAVIQHHLSAGGHLDSVLMISRATLERLPGVVEVVRTALAATS
jgi:hypothetical protein